MNAIIITSTAWRRKNQNFCYNKVTTCFPKPKEIYCSPVSPPIRRDVQAAIAGVPGASAGASGGSIWAKKRAIVG
jgi:hypothetical protein